MRRLLVANRGEIAVRVLRACQDAGVTGIAVYADQDRDAPHARIADESYALNGSTAAQTYLSIPTLIAVAERAGADAVHPGYGFLSESSEFAESVEAAGLLWIGPPADVIRALGDKVRARRIASRVGAPTVAGTADPVASAEEAEAFADEHGLPIAIKAAHGGGGRGLKVVRERGGIRDGFEAAVREATASFGRGECFVERYLDQARHIETQCLADRHGGVVVVSTRDCSLQRRHQKLVEEAPAPFLPSGVEERLRRASEDILSEAGYVGAGTCEFLLGADGTLTFLEVNTRLQVEHPVTEEVTGLDLVAEQLRIAEGGRVAPAPPVRGHSLEFRINGEDPGRGFLPAPGTVTRWRTPSGPGVRVDSGVEEGTVVDGSFDSMLAKLVVTGRTRDEALRRARRALAEFEVDGMATVLPFHRAVVGDPAFAALDGDGFRVHTGWIEGGFDNRIPPRPQEGEAAPGPGERHVGVVEIGSRRIEVSLPAEWGPAAGEPGRTRVRAGRPKRPDPRSRRKPAVADGPGLASPMQGSVVSVAVTEGQPVVEGDRVAVLEAMKMEHPVNAHRDGVVTALSVRPGGTVTLGDLICEIRA